MNTTTTLAVQGMTCQGCVNSISRVLGAIDGVSRVAVSLEQGQVRIEHDPAKADLAQFREAIEAAGYDLAP